MKPAITSPPLPAGALLKTYRDQNHYTDCFCCVLPADVTFSDYVEAFYSTWLFRLERHILALALRRPSSDADVRALAGGACDHFAAWSVEQRAEDQLLLCAMDDRTRSWLMRRASPSGVELYFGSAVIGSTTRHDENPMPAPYRALLGLHRVYSHLLLRAACNRLRTR